MMHFPIIPVQSLFFIIHRECFLTGQYKRLLTYMVEYALSLDSSPQGVILAVEAPGYSTLAKTPWSRKFPENTQVKITALNWAEVDKVGYSFVSWTDGARDLVRTITLTADTSLTAEYAQVDYYPTRNPSRRAKKYTAKTDYEVAQKRVYSLKTLMINNVKTAYTEQAQLEQQVGKYLNSLGLPGIIIHHYRNYSQQLFALKRKFTDQSLSTEATIAAKKWKTRGLDQRHLENIAKILGITLSF
jgi:hypothetical protein